MFAPEVAYPILTVALFAALIWGVWRYRRRNKRLDPMSERVTRAVMDDPGPEPLPEDHAQPVGGRPTSDHRPSAGP